MIVSSLSDPLLQQKYKSALVTTQKHKRVFRLKLTEKDFNFLSSFDIPDIPWSETEIRM